MAFVIIDDNGNLAGMFGIAQNEPTPPGYAVIDDADPRIAPFLAASQALFNPPPTLTFLQFMALFTPTEQVAIVNSTDTQLRLFLLMATGTGTINLAHPEVIAGVNYLVTLNILTTDRATAILANQPPPAS